MAKSSNQKLKLLYILKILQEKTDEQHAMTTQELLAELERYGITAERKSIYNDISELTAFGYDILNNKSKENGGYYLASRQFELPELKLLVDAVQASKFISIKKSRELIEKVENLTSVHEAKQLQRQVYVADRIKTSNEAVYYNVDSIHKGIQENKKLQFKYYEWKMDKEMHVRKAGRIYLVSPFQLIWHEEFYYMVAYDSEADMLKHYRVDKMRDISVVKENREGTGLFKSFNPAQYSNRTFGMFGGAEEMVTLEFSNQMIGVVIDRFGKDIAIRPREDGFFSIRIPVCISSQFFGWLAGLCTEVKILGPEPVKKQYLKYLKEIMHLY